MELTRRELIKVSATMAALGTFSGSVSAMGDPLPSWNDGPAKKAILDFGKATTEKSSSNYLEPKDRIATLTKTERCGRSIRSIRKECSRFIAWAKWPRNIQSGERNNRSRR
jgi:hypothetical protein